MSTLYASIQSQPQPLAGQEHRSSNDFVFHGLPSGRLTVTFTDNPNADRITCTVKRNVSLGTDPEVAFLSMGTKLDASKFEVGAPYYIADPANATASFTVNFEG